MVIVFHKTKTSTKITQKKSYRKRKPTTLNSPNLFLLSSFPNPISPHIKNNGSIRKCDEKSGSFIHIRINMDFPKLLGDHLQQIHPRSKNVQLAIPNITNNDSHGFLFFPCLHPRQNLQTCRTNFNVFRHLP